MKRLALVPVAALLLLVGCTSTHVTRSYQGIGVEGARVPAATVEIENSGWFLLTCLPIASGDPSRPDEHTCNWFDDTVKLENNLSVLDQIRRREGVTEVANLTSHRSDEKYLVFLIARRAYHTSAVLLKPDQTQKTPAETDRK